MLLAISSDVSVLNVFLVDPVVYHCYHCYRHVHLFYIDTSSFSAEARLNYSTVTTDPSILIEVSVVVHHR